MIKNFLDKIESGRKGENKGLFTGLDKLDKTIHGIQPGWAYTIGGDTGSGKSSLGLYSMLYSPFMEMITKGKDNVHFLLFSFEMPSDTILSKLLGLYLYEKENKIISIENMFSFEKKISDKDYEAIIKASDFLEKIKAHFTIADKRMNAKTVIEITRSWTEKFGIYKQISNTKETYTLNDPNTRLIVYIDHVSLLTYSGQKTLKQEIDEMCNELIYCKNKCKLSICFIQQLNRGFKDMARRTANKGSYYNIQLSDFADSSGPTQASEVVISIFFPFREKMAECQKYNIEILRDRFRLLTILKNRWGVSDRALSTGFYGEVNLWKQLPSSTIIDYTKYTNLN